MNTFKNQHKQRKATFVSTLKREQRKANIQNPELEIKFWGAVAEKIYVLTSFLTDKFSL